MATITKETGTGSASSTSYVSEADLTTYAGERGITLGLANGAADELLIKAMDYIESLDFIGEKNTSGQSLLWPRWGAFLDGYSISNDSIPQLLLDAQMEVAISIDAGVNPLANQTRETVREKVGEIEVQYSPTARSVEYLTAAETKLRKLTRNTLRSFRA